MRTVPLIGRVLDLVGLLLFLAGGLLYARAWSGFQGVPDFEPPVDGPAWAAVELANGYGRVQNAGVGLMVAGIGVFVFAWWAARRAATVEGVSDARP